MKTIILFLSLIVSLQVISQTTPKRIKDLTDTQAAYDDDAYLVVDKTGFTAAKKVKIGTIVPEFYKLEIGSWQMNATLYKDVAVSGSILNRVIAIVAVSIIDDDERDIHAGFGIYDDVFYSNSFGGVAEAQNSSAVSTLPSHNHTITGSTYYGVSGGGSTTVLDNWFFANDGYGNSEPNAWFKSLFTDTKTSTITTTVTNSQSSISTGFFGKTISIRAHTDRVNNRIRLMHNNSQVGNGQETAEGNASIASQGQMLNFANSSNNRGYILLMLLPE